jgi:hypothetical protein
MLEADEMQRARGRLPEKEIGECRRVIETEVHGSGRMGTLGIRHP